MNSYTFDSVLIFTAGLHFLHTGRLRFALK